MRITIAFLFVLCLTIIMMTGTIHAQCAMCAAAVQSSDEGMQLARGLNNGILYLLIIPYIIVFGFATSIYFKIKRNNNSLPIFRPKKLYSKFFDKKYQQ